jgi:hypothetical protein
VNNILLNRFRQAGAEEDDPLELAGLVDQRCVEPGVSVLVDGTAREGFRIDTDPQVYGLGVNLDPHVVLTAVIPRDALNYVEVAFAVRPV